MTVVPFLRSVAREFRGSRSRVVYFVLSLSIGVGTVVFLASFVKSIEDGIRGQSRNLLGADFAVEARRPLPKELVEFVCVDDPLDRSEVRELATMASSPRDEAGRSSSLLVELKAVDRAYPLYGEVVLEPAGDLGGVLTPDNVVVAPEVLSSLNVAIGDHLSLGGVSFEIVATVVDEPDRLDFALALGGPRVFLSAEAFARSSLLAMGSRVQYRALFRLAGRSREELDELEERLQETLADAAYLRFASHYDGQPAVRRSLERVESYFGLVALLSLLLGGIGVSQVVGAWCGGRTTEVAVMRCIGFRPSEIFRRDLGHILVLAFVGSLCGSAIGGALPAFLLWLLPDLLPSRLTLSVQPLAIAHGVLLGCVTAVLFALTPLAAVLRVSPARVLRSDADPLPSPRWIVVGTRVALIAGVFLLAWLQSREVVLSLWFTGGIAVLFGLLNGTARGICFLAARVPRRRFNPYLLHGIAALGRPGAGTVGGVIALGLGVAIVVAMALIERGLRKKLLTALPTTAPSMFLIDIQKDQWEKIEEMLREGSAEAIESVPVVQARLSSVDGTSVDELVKSSSEDRRRSRWVLTREQRLTWRAELPPDNQIIEGEFFVAPEDNEVSVEEKYARDLGVSVGSTLQFDVQGIPVDFLVTSVRSVEWQSFGINFFLVAEPGLLDEAPHVRLAAARLPEEMEQSFQDELAAEFPNVTLIRVRSILDRLTELLAGLALGVRWLGALTVVAGVAILMGAISVTNLKRGKEAALLKTLGVTRIGVVLLFATEYALSGAVSGIIGSAGGVILAASFLHFVLEVGVDVAWLGVILAVGGSSLIAAVSGVAASGRALAMRPLETLRG